MNIEEIKIGMSVDDQRAAAKDILGVLRAGDGQEPPVVPTKDDRVSALMSKQAGELTTEEIKELNAAVGEFMRDGDA